MQRKKSPISAESLLKQLNATALVYCIWSAGLFPGPEDTEPERGRGVGAAAGASLTSRLSLCCAAPSALLRASTSSDRTEIAAPTDSNI